MKSKKKARVALYSSNEEEDQHAQEISERVVAEVSHAPEEIRRHRNAPGKQAAGLELLFSDIGCL